MAFDIPQSQWRYYRHWLILIIGVEALMLVLSGYLFEIYVSIAFVFLCGFALRAFKLYPGQPEPLILDLSAVFIALVFAFAARALGPVAWRFLLIFCSSLIVVPHFVYIAHEK